ncbi:MAG: Flp family type IVb pilin [Desulfotomaculaceae bacterium]|nr:Flp family type IVb pilin [Desulfotomaculaceae bacterium]
MKEAMFVILNRLFKDEEGQGLVEYAMILFFVVVALVSMLTAVGVTLKNKYIIMIPVQKPL